MRRAWRAAVGLGGWCLVVALPVAADGKTDARQESVIELRFTESPELTGRALDAEVVGDRVILTGTVKSEEDRALAEKLALDAGMRQVDNKLTIEPPPDPVPEKNPALLTEDRLQRRRAAAAKLREREIETTTQAPAAETATPEPVPAPVKPIISPFQTAPVR